MHFILYYEKVPDFAERQALYASAHGDHVSKAAEAGILMLAGSLHQPATEAVLVFKADAIESVEAFARTDPYVTSGIVVRWTVRAWDLVVGAERLSA